MTAGTFKQGVRCPLCLRVLKRPLVRVGGPIVSLTWVEGIGFVHPDCARKGKLMGYLFVRGMA